MFTAAELDELTIHLRQEENRYTVPREKIRDIYEFSLKIELNTNDKIALCSLALKVLANYIADVPDNAKFVFDMIKGQLPIIPSNETVNDKSADMTTISFFIQVQLILFNNILTTSKEVVDALTCEQLIDRFFQLIEFCEKNSIETDSYLIIEIFEELQTILKEFDIKRFLILREICLRITHKAISENDDEDLQKSLMSLCHKYSINLNCSSLTSDEKEKIFFELYHELPDDDKNDDGIDEQILLNLSYQLRINEEIFLEKFTNLVFKDKKLDISKHIPMTLLLLSNEILSEDTMLKFLTWIDVDLLIDEYFNNIYPKLTLKLPWELQSIAIFNKIPVKMIRITETSISSYINKLKSLISVTTLQVNADVIKLQLTFLSKIFGSNNSNFEMIDSFLKDLKLTEEYGEYPNDFKQLLNQLYFTYLFKFKDNVNELDVKVLKSILSESNGLLNLSIDTKNPTPIQFNYLLELSKIFGFFVASFKNETWFIESFKVFQNVYDNISNQMKEVQDINKNHKYLLSILDNNIKFTNGIILSK